jgi:phosphoribosylamine--glycine ligase
MREIMHPLVAQMAKMGCPYQGVLYAGLMVHEGRPKVLEFNARFGDPECQPLLFRMKSDLVPVLQACIDGTLAEHHISYDLRPAVCVVMASGGYPDRYEKGKPIRGLGGDWPDAYVFHAGTKLTDAGVVTSGGRVLGVTALGADVRAAIDAAYRVVAQLDFEKAYFRRDIGRKALNRGEN